MPIGIGASWVIILPFLFGIHQVHNGVALAQVPSGCFPPEYICREPFWVLKRRTHVSCVLPTRQELFQPKADALCKRNNSHLIRIEKTNNQDLQLLGGLLDQFHIRGFWVEATVRGQKAPTSARMCHAFMQTKRVEEQPCRSLLLEALCEKDAVLRDPKQPLVKLVRSMGQGTQLYDGTDVTFSCDVKRDRAENLSLAFGRPFYRLSAPPNEVITDIVDQLSPTNQKCGVVTLVTFTHTVDKSLGSVHFFCFLVGPTQNCQLATTTDTCTTEGPFGIIDPPEKPEITMFPSKAPDIVFEGKILKAECHTHVDVGSKIEWATYVDSHLTHLHITDPHVDLITVVSNPAWLSTLTIDTAGRQWAGKVVELACYSRSDSINKCEQSHYWCQTASVKIRHGALTPYLRIYYDRPPDVTFVGHTLEARCTAYKALKLQWLKLEQSYSGFDMTYIQDNLHTQRGHDDPIYEVTHKKYGAANEYEVTVLKIYDIPADFDEISIGCFAPITAVSGTFKCEQIPDCVHSAPIRVLDGPKRPILTVPYDRLPYYMFVGSTLLAQCDAHIGDGGTVVLLIHINNTFIINSNSKLGVTIIPAGAAHGGYQTTLLRIDNISATFNGMEIACFSYDINIYPKKHMVCHEWDDYCVVTDPLRVIYQTEIKFTFGQDSILKYPFIWIGWMLVVCFVHFFAWYGHVHFGSTSASDSYQDSDDYSKPHRPWRPPFKGRPKVTINLRDENSG
ncbi:hypothetical protein RRG08_065720 [Elysia crispata]|uniref:C-type lectin domain-containing protein n=1 Tax=Elysia crispata TaxID=231223 RepID=A0AAE1DAV8_9GAST|nr:hypothetical protein RRG08_065720 [Elysia crispata]